MAQTGNRRCVTVAPRSGWGEARTKTVTWRDPRHAAVAAARSAGSTFCVPSGTACSHHHRSQPCWGCRCERSSPVGWSSSVSLTNRLQPDRGRPRGLGMHLGRHGRRLCGAHHARGGRRLHLDRSQRELSTPGDLRQWCPASDRSVTKPDAACLLERRDRGRCRQAGRHRHQSCLVMDRRTVVVPRGSNGHAGMRLTGQVCVGAVGAVCVAGTVGAPKPTRPEAHRGE